MCDNVFPLAEYGADHEPEKQAKKGRPGSLGEHNPGGEFQGAAIFLFGLVITH
jgi:hypothetical protein